MYQNALEPLMRIRRWYRLLEYTFVPVRRQYTEEAGMSEDKAKCYILLSKTQGAARKWINEQDDDIMRDWKRLKQAFIKRFPNSPPPLAAIPGLLRTCKQVNMEAATEILYDVNNFAFAETMANGNLESSC